jgi:nucleoside-diphosphate-sugar epimerase
MEKEWMDQSKRILLTGATGFLGSALAHDFFQKGFSVFVVKRSTSSLARLKDIEGRLTFYDIDQESAADIIKAAMPLDVIVHTATCYGRKGETDNELLQTNVEYPLELLDAAIQMKVPLFVNTSTCLDKMVSAYALSKQQFSEWGKKHAEDGNIAFCDLRLEHMYGPGDNESKFVTYVLHACARNIPNLALTEGRQKRDFIYIDDVVSAYQAVMKHSWQGYHSIAIGSGQNISIRAFVEMVHRMTGSSTQLDFGAIPLRRNEFMQSSPDLTEIHSLGWQSKISLQQGLKMILEKEFPQIFNNDFHIGIRIEF